MNVVVRKYDAEDLPEITRIWNRIVEEGNAFPQEKTITEEEAAALFSLQNFTGVAEADGKILGLYILHPNNIGRCGHIASSSYAVGEEARGMGIGEKLVVHSLAMAKALGFRVMQFNAVVKTNLGALRLYERLGFVRLGLIPGGFRMNDRYEDIIPMYRLL